MPTKKKSTKSKSRERIRSTQQAKRVAKDALKACKKLTLELAKVTKDLKELETHSHSPRPPRR
jgi:hypothetical protein